MADQDREHQQPLLGLRSEVADPHPDVLRPASLSMLVARVQRQAGNLAAQRLVAGLPTVQRYRKSTSMNFGAADSGALTEDRFRGVRAQPWIHEVDVVFDGVKNDALGVRIPTGKATARYFKNAHEQAAFTLDVTGGPRGLRSDPGRFWVHRIEGVGYNDPSAAADIAATSGPAALEGPRRGRHRRYTKPGVGETPATVRASMHLAVLYNRGEALHLGFLYEASHGCVHIDDFDQLTRLNYHSVIGRTRVSVRYTGPAKAVFDP